MLIFGFVKDMKLALDAYATLLGQCDEHNEQFALLLLKHLADDLDVYAEVASREHLLWLAATLADLAGNARGVHSDIDEEEPNDVAYMNANDKDGVPEPEWLEHLAMFVDKLRRRAEQAHLVLTHLEAQQWLEMARTDPEAKS
jgi:hypothetical protein